MLKIGITGGIGSGKSMVCNIIEAIGYPVYHADVEAKKILNTDADVIGAVMSLFGSEVYVSGELQRHKIAALVFENKELLHKLNAIVHPAVQEHFNGWLDQYTHKNLVFKEAAIMFESGAYKQMDKIIAVWAPKDLRISRVCTRDGLLPEQVQKRIDNQMHEDELLKRSDYIIYNEHDKLIVPQLFDIIENLKSISKD